VDAPFSVALRVGPTRGGSGAWRGKDRAKAQCDGLCTGNAQAKQLNIMPVV